MDGMNSIMLDYIGEGAFLGSLDVEEQGFDLQYES
jgi:hypothetical protein